MYVYLENFVILNVLFWLNNNNFDIIREPKSVTKMLNSQ